MDGPPAAVERTDDTEIRIGQGDGHAVGGEGKQRKAGLAGDEPVDPGHEAAGMHLRDLRAVDRSHDRERIDAGMAGAAPAVLRHGVLVVAHVIGEVERVEGRQAHAPGTTGGHPGDWVATR